MQGGHLMRATHGVFAALTLIAGTVCGQGEIDKALGVIQVDLGLPADSFAPTHDSGDYNGDGELDLLLYSSFAEEAWVLIADGAGGWDAEGPFEVDGRSGLAVGQFDADPGFEVAYRNVFDGYAIAMDPGTVPVEFNQPDFPFWDDSPSTDAFAPTIKAADLDGDGTDEIIMNSSGEVLYIVWSGTGAVETIMLPGFGDSSALYDPADYDGDGIIDVLMFSQSRERFWLIEGTGIGLPDVVREIDRVYPSLAGNDRAVFGDLDGISGMDLIVGDTNAQVMVAELNFANDSYISHPIVLDEYGIPLEIVEDLDGSGDADLVVMKLGEYPGVFDFSYIPGMVYDPIGVTPTFAGLDVGFPVSGVPYRADFLINEPLKSLTSADLDHDGDLDLLWFGQAIPNGRFAYGIENRHDESTNDVIGMPSYQSVADTVHVLPMDTDGDGRDEYIMSGERHMRILDLDDGSLGRIVPSLNAFMAVAADIDGDGVDEIVNNDRNTSTLRVFRFLNDGTIGDLRVFTYDGDYEGLEAADLNNDGYTDIVAQIWNGESHIFLGGEGPTLTFSTSVSPIEPHCIKPAAIDYNRDGFMDLALGTAEYGGIQLFLNNGDATFTEGPILEAGSEAHDPYWIVAEDVDLDGITDLVYSDNYQYTVIMFLNEDGTLNETQTLSTGSVVEIVIADLDGNRLPDIVTAGNRAISSTMSPGVLIQNTPRSISEHIVLPGGSTEAIALSDADQDGQQDLVALSSQEQKLRVFYGQADPCPADLNGDGTLNYFDVSVLIVEQPDYNSDGSFNFFDVSAFLVDFKAGCP